MGIFQEVIKEKQLIVSNEISTPITTLGDSFMISTILRNLLSNAMKYTPKKGYITIGAIPNNIKY